MLLHATKEANAAAILTELVNIPFRSLVDGTVLTTNAQNENDTSLTKLLDELQALHTLTWGWDNSDPALPKIRITSFDLTKLMTQQDIHRGEDLDARVRTTAGLIISGLQQGEISASASFTPGTPGKLAIRLQQTDGAPSTCMDTLVERHPHQYQPSTGIMEFNHGLTLSKWNREFERAGIAVEGLNEALQTYRQSANPNLKFVIDQQDKPAQANGR